MSYADDFTTFTEVDPDSKITKTATQIDAQLDRTNPSYVYKDYGVDRFGTDLEHQFTLRPYNAQSTGSFIQVWALSNEIGGLSQVQEEIGLAVQYYSLGPIYKGMLFHRVEGVNTWSPSYFSFSYNDTRYITIIRSGSTLTGKLYTDVGRTNLQKTITRTGCPTTSYRYIYGVQNYGSGSSYHKVSAQIRNFVYDEDPNMVNKIKGTKSDTARIIVLNESDWNIDSNAVVSGSGAYEVETVDTESKTIIARDGDGWVKGYGNIIPITE